MAITSANRYLTRVEMEGNAEFIWSFFKSNGWTMSAVAAMLGNMETESTINPGIYENLDATSTTNGFGLVQWTPNTKYKEWADEYRNATDYGDIIDQVARIRYELQNDIQWIPTNKYNMSFAEFSTSTMSPEYLAQAFLYNYERPANLQQPNRSTQARRWYTFLNGLEGGTEPDNPDRPKPKQLSKFLLYFAGSKRR